jgi:cellulose synthase/poly-beta-1,6-N-acetylglucosamine synthase-like glycosyltransferase
MTAVDISTFLLIFCSSVILALAWVLLIETVASFTRPRQQAPSPMGKPFRFAVLVPAHNEALVIEDTIARLLPQLSSTDRILVVADNCSDNTAVLAEAAGAEVIHRDDPQLRGKGYALDYGLRHLAADPPDAVIVVDADCTVGPGCLREIAELSISRQRPVQARYEMEVEQGDSPDYLSVASFAWTVKNYVRPLGLSRMGLPCQLMGTGMAFPWEVISRANLKTGNIVEDLALGLDLAAAGFAPVFHPTAWVRSSFPVSREGQTTQRTRWETGHLQMIWRDIPRMLTRGARSGNRDLIVLACDAAVPPLTFLCFSMGILFSVAFLLATAGGSLIPLGITSVAACAVVLSVVLSARHLRPGAAGFAGFGLVVKYAAMKIAIYANALPGRPTQWIRSKRD